MERLVGGNTEIHDIDTLWGITKQVVRPGTREEFDAISAMMGGIRACVPAGARFELDATVIGYRLVEGLLRLAPAAATRPGN